MAAAFRNRCSGQVQCIVVADHRVQGIALCQGFRLPSMGGIRSVAEHFNLSVSVQCEYE